LNKALGIKMKGEPDLAAIEAINMARLAKSQDLIAIKEQADAKKAAEGK